MNEGLIAKRYAKALIDFAEPLNEAAAMYGYMKVLYDNLGREPRLRYVLASPVISKEDKGGLICAAAGAKNEGVFGSFVKLVTDNQRETLLRGIAICYMDIYRKLHNISVVHITTTEPMSDDFENRIRADVAHKTQGEVEMEVHIDPSIDGGFIFQVDDLRLDASVRGQLETIRRQFIKRNRAIV